MDSSSPRSLRSALPSRKCDVPHIGQNGRPVHVLSNPILPCPVPSCPVPRLRHQPMRMRITLPSLQNAADSPIDRSLPPSHSHSRPTHSKPFRFSRIANRDRSAIPGNANAGEFGGLALEIRKTARRPVHFRSQGSPGTSRLSARTLRAPLPKPRHARARSRGIGPGLGPLRSNRNNHTRLARPSIEPPSSPGPPACPAPPRLADHRASLPPHSAISCRQAPYPICNSTSTLGTAPSRPPYHLSRPPRLLSHHSRARTADLAPLCLPAHDASPRLT
jgi:hypothetical protein